MRNEIAELSYCEKEKLRNEFKGFIISIIAIPFVIFNFIFASNVYALISAFLFSLSIYFYIKVFSL